MADPPGVTLDLKEPHFCSLNNEKVGVWFTKSGRVRLTFGKQEQNKPKATVVKHQPYSYRRAKRLKWNPEPAVGPETLTGREGMFAVLFPD